MNLSYFIAKRISKSEDGSFSSTIHKVAILSIGLGLAIMIISFFILFGFQNTVKEKIFGLSSHIQITKYTLNQSLESIPISNQNDFYLSYGQYEFIDHVQEYAHKAGLIRTDEDILGVVIKGVGEDFDQNRFAEYMIEGEFIKYDTLSYSKDVVLSKAISNKLKVGVGDKITVHFFQNPPRARRLNVTGIYETNLSEYFDNKMVLADINMIRRLNGWSDSLSSGFEVYLKDYKEENHAESVLDNALDFDLFIEKVSDKFIQVFEWLGLIRRQVNIFLSLILFVVCFNMISIILILIMERTQMIGMLKALGATNKQIRKVFSYTGMQLVAKGLILGNFIALVLGAIQYHFKVIPLNAKDYYMSYVPISWEWDMLIILNLLTFMVVMLILALPTIFITKIQPIKAIRFD